MRQYLRATQILLKEFGAHVERVSREIKEASLAEAASLGRPVQYLSSSQVSKEDIAGGIASREAKKLELEPRRRQCLFL